MYMSRLQNILQRTLVRCLKRCSNAGRQARNHIASVQCGEALRKVEVVYFA